MLVAPVDVGAGAMTARRRGRHARHPDAARSGSARPARPRRRRQRLSRRDQRVARRHERRCGSPSSSLAALVVFLAATAQAALVYIDRARLRHMLEEGTPRASALNALAGRAEQQPVDDPVRLHAGAVRGGRGRASGSTSTCGPALRRGSPSSLALAAAAGAAADAVSGRVVAAGPTGARGADVRAAGRGAESTLFFILAAVERARRAGFAALLGVQHGLTPADAEDRLRHLVEGNTDLEEDEREMIASVIELGEQPVREIMVPRIDIVAAPSDLDGARRARPHRRQRPLAHPDLRREHRQHHRRGVRQGPAASSCATAARRRRVKPLAREPSFVPETKKVDELLHEMQQKPRPRGDRGRRVRRHGRADHHRGPDRGDRRRDPRRVRRRGRQ